MPANYFRHMTAGGNLFFAMGSAVPEPDRPRPTIAVLPLGATEQHGPHLPFETDTIIAQTIVDAAKEKLRDTNLDVQFLPVEQVGYSIEHSATPGTRTLTWDAAVNRWIGIGEACQKRGIEKFVMLNAHGGNSPLMTVVATELRVRLAMLAVATSWTRFALPGGLISAEEKALGIHGGEIETSVMLAARPDLVDMAKAADFPSLQGNLSERFTHLRAYGPHAFGWMMGDLNADGVTGNAAAATAENGRAIIDAAAGGFVDLLHEIDRFEPPWVDEAAPS